MRWAGEAEQRQSLQFVMTLTGANLEVQLSKNGTRGNFRAGWRGDRAINREGPLDGIPTISYYAYQVNPFDYDSLVSIGSPTPSANPRF